jgi:hypothetical protein
MNARKEAKLKSFIKSTEWREAVDSEGKVYYFDKSTLSTQWEKPKIISDFEEQLELEISETDFLTSTENFNDENDLNSNDHSKFENENNDDNDDFDEETDDINDINDAQQIEDSQNSPKLQSQDQEIEYIDNFQQQYFSDDNEDDENSNTEYNNINQNYDNNIKQQLQVFSVMIHIQFKTKH